MGYGFEIPSSIQPKDAANMLPGQVSPPTTFGSLFDAKSMPAQMPEASPDVAQAPNQVSPSVLPSSMVDGGPTTFGDLFSPQTDVRPRAYGTPGKPPPDINEQAKQQSAVVDKTVSQLGSTLSESEKKAQEETNHKQSMDDLLAEVRDMVGDNPAPLSDFQGPTASNPHNFLSYDWLKEELQRKATLFRSSFGDSKKAELAAAKSMFENDQGGRAEMRNGTIYFRSSSDEKMRPLDEKSWGRASGFLGMLFNDASGIQDKLLGHAGAITQGGVTAVTEGGLLAASAAEAGTGAGAPVGLATAMGASSIAGATGALVKTRMQQAMDAVSSQKQLEDDHNIVSDMAWGAGLNASTLGILKGGTAGAKTLVSLAKSNFYDLTPKTRIAQLIEIRNQLDKFVEKVGAGIGPKAGGLRQAGTNAYGVIDAAGDQLAENVTMVKQKVLSLAEQNGTGTVQASSLISKMKEILENRFVHFDSNGYASLPSETAKEAYESAQYGGTPYLLDEAKADFGASKALTSKAFGSDTGQRTISKLVEDYNNLLASNKSAGGVQVRTLLDHIDAYRNQANLEKQLMHTDQETAVYRELQHAAANDRHEAFQSILAGSGTQEEAVYQKVFDQYHAKIDDVMEFRKIFGRQESAQAFTESLVQPGNIERVDKLKNILGSQSQEWNTFRAEYLNKLFSDSTDANTGIFLANSFRENTKRIGNDVMNSLFSASEVKAITQLTLAAKKVPFADLINPQEQATVKNAMIALMPMHMFASSRVRALWGLFGKSAQAMDWIKTEGLMQAAREAPDKGARAAIQEVQSFLDEAMKQMTDVAVPRVDPRTGAQIIRHMYVPTIKAGVRQGLIQSSQIQRMATGADDGVDDTSMSSQQ